jgi:hypothetical protein
MSSSSQHDTTETFPETVLCFDRDYTVSVNPHPDRTAVPLSWVKYFAHYREDIDVWATGNQTLTEEASIPGIGQAVSCWRAITLPDDIERYHTFVSPQSGRLSRREGLQLIQAVYDHVETHYDHSFEFLVVDDVDLSELEGWDHFYPWEFTRAVDDRNISITPPDPLESISDVPCTEPDCPESYPPIDYDEPIVLKRLQNL